MDRNEARSDRRGGHYLARHWGLTLTGAIAFSAAMNPPLDPDLGWHLRAGERFLATKLVPRTDPFSHTLPAYPWVDFEWLSNAWTALLHRMGGPTLLVLFFAAATAGAFLLVYRYGRLRATGDFENAVLLVLGAVVSRYYLGARFLTFTLVGMALAWVLLLRAHENRSGRPLLLLPPLFLLWANLHASFLAGLGLVGIFLAVELEAGCAAPPASASREAAFRQAKRLAAALAAGFLLALVNPYGARLLVAIFSNVGHHLSMEVIDEWRAPDFHDENGLLFAIFLVVVVGLVTLAVDPPSGSGGETAASRRFLRFAVLLPFLWLALQSVRHIPLFCLLAAPLAAPLLAALVRSPSARGPARFEGLRTGFPAVALALALLLATIQSITVLAGTVRNRDLSAFRDFPSGAVRHLREHPPRGNLFHEYDWGGFLIWTLPGVPVFVDGRMSYWEDRKEEKDLFRDYLRIKGQRPGFEEILDRYSIGTCLIRTDTGLRTRLLTCAPWREVYHDTLACVLERVGPVPGFADSTREGEGLNSKEAARASRRSPDARGASSRSAPAPRRPG